MTSQIGVEMFLVGFSKEKIIVASLKGVSGKLPCEKSELILGSWQRRTETKKMKYQEDVEKIWL